MGCGASAADAEIIRQQRRKLKPSKWEAAWEPRTKQWYFQDRANGRSTWEKPPDFNGEIPRTPPPPPEDAPDSDSEAVLPEGWEYSFDASHRRHYYYHRETGVSQWTRPGDKPPMPPPLLAPPGSLEEAELDTLRRENQRLTKEALDGLRNENRKLHKEHKHLSEKEAALIELEGTCEHLELSSQRMELELQRESLEMRMRQCELVEQHDEAAFELRTAADAERGERMRLERIATDLEAAKKRAAKLAPLECELAESRTAFESLMQNNADMKAECSQIDAIRRENHRLESLESELPRLQKSLGAERAENVRLQCQVAVVEGLRRENARLETQDREIATLHETFSFMRRETQKLELQNVELRAFGQGGPEVEAYKRQLIDVTHAEGQLSGELRRLEAHVQKEQHAYHALRLEHRELDRTEHSAQEQLSTLRAERRRLERYGQTEQDAFHALRAEHRESAAGRLSLREEVLTLRGERMELEASEKREQDMVHALRSKQQQLINDELSIHEQVTNMRLGRRTLEIQERSEQEALRQLRTEHKEMNVAALRMREELLASRIKVEQSELNAMGDDVSQERSRGDMQNFITESKSEFQRLHHECQSLEVAMSELRELEAESRRQTSQWQGECNRLEWLTSELTQHKSQLDAEACELQKQCSSLESVQSELVARNSVYEQERRLLRAEFAQSGSEMAALSDPSHQGVPGSDHLQAESVQLQALRRHLEEQRSEFWNEKQSLQEECSQLECTRSKLTESSDHHRDESRNLQQEYLQLEAKMSELSVSRHGYGMDLVNERSQGIPSQSGKKAGDEDEMARTDVHTKATLQNQNQEAQSLRLSEECVQLRKAKREFELECIEQHRESLRLQEECGQLEEAMCELSGRCDLLQNESSCVRDCSHQPEQTRVLLSETRSQHEETNRRVEEEAKNLGNISAELHTETPNHLEKGSDRLRQQARQATNTAEEPHELAVERRPVRTGLAECREASVGQDKENQPPAIDSAPVAENTQEFAQLKEAIAAEVPCSPARMRSEKKSVRFEGGVEEPPCFSDDALRHVALTSKGEPSTQTEPPSPMPAPVEPQLPPSMTKAEGNQTAVESVETFTGSDAARRIIAAANDQPASEESPVDNGQHQPFRRPLSLLPPLPPPPTTESSPEPSSLQQQPDPKEAPRSHGQQQPRQQMLGTRSRLADRAASKRSVATPPPLESRKQPKPSPVTPASPEPLRRVEEEEPEIHYNDRRAARAADQRVLPGSVASLPRSAQGALILEDPVGGTQETGADDELLGLPSPLLKLQKDLGDHSSPCAYIPDEDGELRRHFRGPYWQGFDLLETLGSDSYDKEPAAGGGEGGIVYVHKASGIRVWSRLLCLAPMEDGDDIESQWNDLELLFVFLSAAAFRKAVDGASCGTAVEGGGMSASGPLGIAELQDGVAGALFGPGVVATRREPSSLGSKEMAARVCFGAQLQACDESGASMPRWLQRVVCCIPVLAPRHLCYEVRCTATPEMFYGPGRDSRGRLLPSGCDPWIIRVSDSQDSAQHARLHAEKRLRLEVAVREAQCGSYHEDVVGSMRALARHLKCEGRAEEAEPFYRRVLDADERVFGKAAPQTLISVNNLATCLGDLGHHAEAELLHSRAVHGKEKAMGKDHPSTLASVSNLAACFHAQGKAAEAEELFHYTLSACRSGLPSQASQQTLPSHTLASVSNLAACMSDQGKLKEAENLCWAALEGYERDRGAEHPDTLVQMSNLAACLGEQGRLQEAEALLRRSFVGCERALGPNHPRTLRAASNLAGCLQDQGDKAGEAEKLFRRALEISQRTMGSSHPSTVECSENLAAFLEARGRPIEAELLRRV